MTELKTSQYYHTLAKTIKFPTGAFINGAFVPAVSGKTFSIYNPATNEEIAKIADCQSEDVNIATHAARKSFDDGVWCKRSPLERKITLLKFAELLEKNIEELAVLECLDSGKPVGECINIDVADAIYTIRWHAELIDKIYDNTTPTGSGQIAMVVRQPIGVVGLVLPWNFPLLMAAWKIGPALAAGCSIVLKPAQETTLTTLKLAEIAHQVGIPAGVLNIVPGSGQAVGEPIGCHMDIDMVSFTGSTAIGRRFLHYSAQSNLKRIVLECGGKNPAVVLADVDDIDKVAAHVVNGAFWNMGENCSATSRLIVHEDIKDILIEKIINHMKSWKMGDPLDPENRVGTLVSKAHFKKVSDFLDEIDNEKRKLVVGGHTHQKIYVEPTVVDQVTPESRLFQEEIFGPILSVTTFKTIEEAVRLANDTRYGLAASIYTSNLRNAMLLSRAIYAGIVTVNCFGEGDATTHFGGFKESGFGGRDKSIWAHDQYTELKTIWIDIS